VVVGDEPAAVALFVDEGVARVDGARSAVDGQVEVVDAGVDGGVVVQDGDDLLGERALRLFLEELLEVVDEPGAVGAHGVGQCRQQHGVGGVEIGHLRRVMRGQRRVPFDELGVDFLVCRAVPPFFGQWSFGQ
jgi:hypothetical protein